MTGTLSLTPASPPPEADFIARNYGARGDGAADDTSPLQALFTAAAGKMAYVGAGTYRVTAPVEIPSNTVIYLHPRAKILRDFALAGTGHATFINANQGTSDSNIVLIGGEFASNTAMTGKHLGFMNVTGLRVDNVRISSVSGDWTTSFRFCADVIVKGCWIDAGTVASEDGLHFVGCHAVTVSDCVIHSGDDCISFTQEGTSTQDTYDVTVENCYVESRAANGIRISVAAGETKKIQRVAIRGVVGKAYAQAIKILDQNSARGLISDIVISDCLFDQSANTGSGMDASYADRVTLENVTIESPAGTNFDLRHLTQLALIGCVANPGPRTAAVNNFTLDDVDGFRIIGCYGSGGTLFGLQAGPSNACSNGIVVGNRFDGATQQGIKITNATACLVVANKITSSGGGIDEVSPSNNNTFAENDVSGLATRVTITGSSSIKHWNKGDTTVKLQDPENFQLGTGTGTKIGTSATQKLGFFNATPIVQPTVTGSRGANAALASLLTQLAALGLIVDSSS